jgi:hypothetical protein
MFYWPEESHLSLIGHHQRYTVQAHGAILKKKHGQNLSSTSGEAEPSAQYFFQNWAKAEATTLGIGLPEKRCR